MKIFKLISDNTPSLRERCKEVEEPYSNEVIDLLKDMVEYLKISQDEKLSKKYNIREGVGLAAPQIGVNIKALAVYYPKYNQNDEIEYVQYGLINPRILSNSVKQAYLQSGEGCLSVKNEHEGYVYRSNKIIVKAYDVFQDKIITLTLKGLDAIVMQHELDHLNGVLFYDHIDKNNPFKIVDNAIAI